MNTEPVPTQELRNLELPEFYEAAGNRFAILLFTDPNTQDGLISVRSAEVFQQNPSSIDTVLVLVKLDNQRFKYLVIERDGSWSEMCGNGARAVAKYLYDLSLAKPGQPIILVTKSGKEIGVKALEIDGDTWYRVNMGRVSSVEEDLKSFEGLLEQGFDGNLERLELNRLIFSELSKYLNNPQSLKDLFPDLLPDGQPNPLSMYSSYFYEILQRVNTEDEFNQFVQALAYRGLYQAGGEPHTLIEITNPTIVATLGDVKFSVYLKAVSFLLRHSQDQHCNRLYPQSMNFMFYVIQEDPNKTVEQPTVGEQTSNFTVTMYPAERGVHNGISYDQTGACGTGSCCLGNYLLKHDSRFMALNQITIVNRSGISLIVALDDEGNTQLIGQAEKTAR